MRTSAPSSRDVARMTLTVVAVLGALYLLWLVRGILLLLVVAAFLAIVLTPPVDFLQRRVRLPRPVAILAVYAVMLAAGAGLAILFVPPVVEQSAELAEDLPGYVRDLRDSESIRELDDRYDLTGRLEAQAQTLVGRIGDAAGALQDIAGALVSAAFQLITILTIAFLLLLQGRRIATFLLAMRGPANERRYAELAARMYRSTAGYVAGVLTIAAINGTGTLVVLSILGVPFAIPLAVIMGLFGLIPLVGATIGAVVVGVVTLFHDFPTATIVWAIYALVYQQLENNLLQPLVYRRTVNVPPLMVLVSVLVLSSLLGVFGALVAIPVAAAVQILARDWWIRRGAPPQAEPKPPPELSAEPAVEPG